MSLLPLETIIIYDTVTLFPEDEYIVLRGTVTLFKDWLEDTHTDDEGFSQTRLDLWKKDLVTFLKEKQLSAYSLAHIIQELNFLFFYATEKNLYYIAKNSNALLTILEEISDEYMEAEEDPDEE